MFLQRLRSIFARGRDKRNGVFTCSVGGKTITLDPAIVRRKLNEKCPDWDELVDRIQQFATPLVGNLAADPKLASSRTATAEQAVTTLADAITFAFDAPPLQPDGSGYSEAERIQLLTQYLQYVQGVLERTRPLAISPAATASPAGAN